MHVTIPNKFHRQITKAVIAKALVGKLPKSRRYRPYRPGYSICLVFLKLLERIHSPLTAGLVQPYRADAILQWMGSLGVKSQSSIPVKIPNTR
jgi:hypothetical protein